MGVQTVSTRGDLQAYRAEEAIRLARAENLKKPHIKSYIDERLEAINSAKIASQEEVLQYLTAVMRGETAATEVVVEGEGDGVSCARLIEKPPNEKERIRAAELLGKRYGAFTDKVSVDGNIAVEFVGYDDVEE